jgi:hypothetical protein
MEHGPRGFLRALALVCAAAATLRCAPSPSTAAAGCVADGSPSCHGASTVDAGLSKDSGPSEPPGIDPPPLPVEVTLTTDTFTLSPGAEAWECQLFATPFGQDVDLVRMDGTMSDAGVLFYVFSMDPSNQDLYGTLSAGAPPPKGRDCPGKGLEFHPFAYLSQQPHRVEAFAPDMGYPLPAKNALVIDLQVLNTGSVPVQASARITLTRDVLGAVTNRVGHIQLVNESLSVPITPASSPSLVTMTWDPTASTALSLPPLPATFRIFSSWSYMTRTGLEFQATTNGAVFYDQKSAHQPSVVQHSPALSLTSSQSISWSCSFYDDGSLPLRFGDSALSNAMCIYIGEYYPADPASPDLIDLQF